MMHKSFLMIAGLLSVLPAMWWLRAKNTAPATYPQQPVAIPSPVPPLQENLTNNSFSPYKSDTVGWPTESLFAQPPVTAKPWVFWYWMQASVSKAGITADLEAMQQAGIAGAYLVSIKDSANPALFNPPVRQLSKEWWDMVRHAMLEAKRLHLQLAFHVSDGFALAGGPWITPELSMQKLVWTREYVKGGDSLDISLPQPEAKEDYYKDVAVLAYPANSVQAFSDTVLIPRVTTSIPGAKAQFLAFDNGGKDNFRSDSVCWIQYKYPQPFTCRSVRIHVTGRDHQAQRLLLQASDDGEHFRDVVRLEPPRAGWQDTEEDVTHSIPTVSALYYRFVYDKTGTEPGAEDLDAAKWKPVLKVAGIYMSDEPVLNQFESKNGSVWRVSKRTTAQQVPDSLAVPLKDIVNLTDKMDSAGKLTWKAPAGNWVIVRIGHTSTGQKNATGGAGKGLECDKFNPAAAKLQFDNWFGEAVRVAGPQLAKDVLKIFHMDSWECGSQNWSTGFAAEFKKRRKYDLTTYLLAMTGTPVENATVSEGFLFDVRQTIAELVVDNFYAPLAKLAHGAGTQFNSETIAPTMLSDGMAHYRYVDLPMGEFWLNSPTHDKPNDVYDAVSGAHVYGKPIVQAESFTTLRMDFSEHPGMLKTLGDRNFALGINRLALHVFVHNPWTDRQPGMTLDGIGMFFQRDQTWWKPGKAWIDYLSRCQALLQLGRPVNDVAVFTGEELPRRAVLPNRLVSTLPGIIGAERVAAENKRLENAGTPLRTLPAGVSHSANMADPEKWIDPLRGYAYDAINPDALLRLATVKNNRIVLPGGASYGVLVLPASHTLHPHGNLMTAAVEQKIAQLVKSGATVIVGEEPVQSPSLQDNLERKTTKGWGKINGKGKLLNGPYTADHFNALGIEQDLIALEVRGVTAADIAWTHRQGGRDFDIYFIANQQERVRELVVSLRVSGRQPEIWDPVDGSIKKADAWGVEKGRTKVALRLEANGSVFIVLRKKAGVQPFLTPLPYSSVGVDLPDNWQVTFDPKLGGPAKPVVFPTMTSWARHPDTTISYYSGTAIYKNTFEWTFPGSTGIGWLEMDSVYNMASVKVNGVDCGTVWTYPYRLDIGKALKKGTNTIEIAVTNTWANRLAGDERLPAGKRITWTNSPYRSQNKPLQPAGLVGKVQVVIR